MSPVMMKGMSRVLFNINASLTYIPFEMKSEEPIWRAPMIMKNRIDTFLMFLIVSIGGIIQQGLVGGLGELGWGFCW